VLRGPRGTARGRGGGHLARLHALGLRAPEAGDQVERRVAAVPQDSAAHRLPWAKDGGARRRRVDDERCPLARLLRVLGRARPERAQEHQDRESLHLTRVHFPLQDDGGRRAQRLPPTWGLLTQRR